MIPSNGARSSVMSILALIFSISALRVASSVLPVRMLLYWLHLVLTERFDGTHGLRLKVFVLPDVLIEPVTAGRLLWQVILLVLPMCLLWKNIGDLSGGFKDKLTSSSGTRRPVTNISSVSKCGFMTCALTFNVRCLFSLGNASAAVSSSFSWGVNW